jgi:Tfp pilus assembly protein PilO
MSRTVRLALMGLAVVVLAVLCWFFMLSPLRSDIAAAEQAIEDQRQQIMVAQTALAQAESKREEGRQNQARLLELNKMVPPSVELPSLLLQLQDLADQSGIQLIAVTPSQPRAVGENSPYQIVELALQFTGTYFDVSDFAYRAEQMVAGPGRLLAIKTLSLEAGDAGEAGGSPELGVNINLYAYILADVAVSAPATVTPAEEGSTQ